MSQQVFEIMQGMNRQDIEMQMALQCAPLITGLKISNLLIIPNGNVHRVQQIVKNSELSFAVLLAGKEKTTLLLYKEELLIRHLSQSRIQQLLHRMGYEESTLIYVLAAYRLRYQEYMESGKNFPHEMGVLLGYPIEDVEGFIDKEGKDFLYIGYWKVYEDLAEKLYMFQQYDSAKEMLIRMLSLGIGITDIMESYSGRSKMAAV